MDSFAAESVGVVLLAKISLTRVTTFETEEVARTAIEKVNGMLLNSKKVYVFSIVCV